MTQAADTNREKALSKNRAGRLIAQTAGYQAFIPNTLPPNPPLAIDTEMMSLLAEAERSLGRLDGLTPLISEPDLFVYLYVRKEALLSSQIEGTQCSLEDILSEEDGKSSRPHDIEEVSNYVLAMNRGLARLKSLPIASRLIREMHAILMAGVRGSNKTPGEFRTSQNWIGRPGASLKDAEFIPPPPHEVAKCMGDLEQYIHNNEELPPLIRAAFVHAQFETIHPFLDGNGRLGRLLITYLLCYWNVMEKPLLYLSYFFKAHRTEYYSRLMAVRLRGDWEGWIKFFLRGVAETAKMANAAALDICRLHQTDREKIQRSKPTAAMGEVFHHISRNPLVTIPELENMHKSSSSKITIRRATLRLVQLGILKPVGKELRNKRYLYAEYMRILTRDTKIQMG